MVNSEPVGTILAVDDTPENLDVLKAILSEEYQIKVAINGQLALKIASTQLPDLILLDVMMPEMDGYEVCRRLKSDPATRDIPIIFVTAKGDTSDEAEGFAIGAADYILKPVNPTLLKARIKTQLTLKQQMDELQSAYKTIARQTERMQEELNFGRSIQLGMVPDKFPAFPDREEFDIHAVLLPAREIGGDFYDFFLVSWDKLCVCIGDVSGKGVPAALFMAVTKTLIRSTASEDHSPASIVTRVNSELSDNNPSCMFVTLFLGILDLHSGDFVYTNAGHPYPYLKRAKGEVETIEQLHGPVVGMMDGLSYTQGHLKFETDDRFLTFSDGITEAMDSAEQLYGCERLESLLEQIELSDCEAMIKATLADVAGFVGEAEQSDDISVLALKVLGEPAEIQQQMNLTIANRLSELEKVSQAMNDLAGSCAIPEAITSKLNIALDELLTNVITHAYTDDDLHSVEVKLAVDSERVTISVVDKGLPFNPLDQPEPDIGLSLDKREVGGLGIHIVRKIMDEVHYQRSNNRNIVTIMKDLSR